MQRRKSVVENNTFADDVAELEMEQELAADNETTQIRGGIHQSSEALCDDELFEDTPLEAGDNAHFSFLARIDKTAERQRLRSQPQGKVLRDRFKLLETLGSGGMGDVYLAKDLLREEMEDSSPYIALKLLNEDCQVFPGALQALQREAKKAQALSHPNIVTVFDFDRCGDIAFISMEYLQGQTLKDYLVNHGTMPHARAMRVIELAARGLAYAHSKGFIHADIKPANIFLMDDGSVKILDFGIARAVNQVQEKQSAGDELTAFALTPNYATVGALNGKPASEKDDIYALACVAYQLLTGRHPYTSEQGLPLSARDAQMLGLRVEHVLGLSRRHMRALRRALRYDSENSFNNAGEFIDAIKPRNQKRFILSTIAAAVAAIALWVGAQHYIESRVPTLNDLPVAFSSVTTLIEEGDRSLQLHDLDLAHRLYSQAWFDAQAKFAAHHPNDLLLVKSIVEDRINKVAEALVERVYSRELSEFQLREYLSALEFFAETEFIQRPHKIRKAIAHIRARIQNAD